MNFQMAIEEVLEKHGKLEEFKSSEEFHMRLDLKGYDRLVIERIGKMISVAHYFEQNGDLIADPDVELEYPSWTPKAIQQVFGYREKCGEADVKFHEEVSKFLEMWAANIFYQSWAALGILNTDSVSDVGEE
jgi:hypothetical protein